MLNNARGWKVAILVLFLSIFSCCTKSGDQPKKVLPKFVYKTNKEGGIVGIQSHVGDPLEPIS